MIFKVRCKYVEDLPTAVSGTVVPLHRRCKEGSLSLSCLSRLYKEQQKKLINQSYGSLNWLSTRCSLQKN